MTRVFVVRVSKLLDVVLPLNDLKVKKFPHQNKGHCQKKDQQYGGSWNSYSFEKSFYFSTQIDSLSGLTGSIK